MTPLTLKQNRTVLVERDHRGSTRMREVDAKALSPVGKGNFVAAHLNELAVKEHTCRPSVLFKRVSLALGVWNWFLKRFKAALDHRDTPKEIYRLIHFTCFAEKRRHPIQALS